MARRKVELLLKEADSAWDDKRLWWSLLEECYEYALPNRNPYFAGDGTGIGNQKTQGSKKTTRLFDSTLPNSVMKVSNRLVLDIMPPGRRWGALKPGALVQAAQKDNIAKQLQPIEEALFTAIGLSNFDMSIHEWMLELLTAGTSVMAILEGEDDVPVEYLCIPQSQVALREGPNGKIWGMYRKHELRAGLIEDQWPDAKVNLEHHDDEDKITFDECLYYSRKDGTWYYDVIMHGGKKSGKDKGAQRIVEREYKEGIWVVSRWIKAVGETHGRSLVMQALPDAKTLNKLKELLLQNASLAVKGVWLGRQDGILNTNAVNIVPGAIIPVHATGGAVGASLTRLDVGGDLQLGQFIFEDMVQSIKSTMMDKSLPPQTGSVRSATEIIERLREAQIDFGSPIGRLIYEGIIPILQATVGVLGRKGIIPMQQDGKALQLNGASVKVELTSPVVQAQNLADVENTVQWAQISQSIVGPETFMMTAKIEDIPEYIAGKMGVHNSVIRDKTEREQVQQFVSNVAAGSVGIGQNATVSSGNDNAQLSQAA